MEQDDASFRALADPSRRVLLDRLYERDGQALGELQTALPQMSRIAVMKHLRILEAAGLVVSHRSGRRRLHYLNPVPIRRIHDRWLDKFRARAADVLLTLQAFMEEPTMGSDSTDRPSHISQIYIRATPAEVWRAITESEFTLQYYYGSTVESEWQRGLHLPLRHRRQRRHPRRRSSRPIPRAGWSRPSTLAGTRTSPATPRPA